MRKLLLFLPLVLLLPAGCQKKPEIDYSPLDESGMWSTSLAEIKKMKVSSFGDRAAYDAEEVRGRR